MSGSAANLDIIMDGSSTKNKQNTNDENMADGAPQVQENNSEEELVLPPEVWASVMEYLPFETVLSCGAVSKQILHDAMPLITKLSIDKSSQMNLAVASRFRDIEEIHINSLLKVSIFDDDFTDISVDTETKIRTVHFLSRFNQLERVIFWAKDAQGNIKAATECYWYEGEGESYPDEASRPSMLAFLDSISGAYICGVLPNRLKISGLCCPDTTGSQRRNNNCETCLRACKSFPLNSVAEFECRQSSTSNGMAGRMYGLDVCLDRATLESIIESRPGGKKLLRSKDRLLRLLGSGKRHVIPSDDGKSLNFVKYTQTELNEIKRVIEYAELKVEELDAREVSAAVRDSFSGYGNRSPHKNECILSESSLQYLNDTIGLPIDREDFERPLVDLIGHTHQIVSVLNQSDGEVNNEGSEEEVERYDDIVVDCLRLVRQFLEVENNPPVQQAAKAIQSLANCLDSGDDDRNLEAAHSLVSILTKGTDENRNKILEHGGIRKFYSLLDPTNDSHARVSSRALADLVPRGTDDEITTFAELGAIPTLIDLLDSKHKDCVNSSLQVLVAAKEHIKDTDYKSLLTGLVINMNIQAHDQSDKLLNCSVLLRGVLEADKPPIQTVIDFGVVPRLIEILTTTENDAIHLNLECVVINLLAGTKEQLDMLVTNTGFLPLLVNLVESQHVGIPEIAILALGKVADASSRIRDILLQAGIVQPLLRVLQGSDVVLTTLEAASGTLAACCLGVVNGFATDKETLNVLANLLGNKHETVLYSSSWAVFHILDRLTDEEVNEVMNIGFIEPLLKLLPNAPQDVQDPVLKSLHLISLKGDKCIKKLFLHDGISYLSKVLSNSDLNEKNQKRTCYAITNIISGSRDRVQSAIDNDVVPSLVKSLALEQNNKPKEAALSVLYRMTKAGSASQIKYLFTEGCLNSLFDMLNITDCRSTVVALQTISCILSVGKQQSPNKARLLSSGIQDIEKKLRVLTDQNTGLHQNNERVELLLKKIAWLEVGQQNECVESLKKAPGLLQEQLGDNDQRLQSIVQKIADVGENSPLGQVYVKLKSKEEEARQFLLTQVSATETEIGNANDKLNLLKSNAEKVAPAEKWQERLARDDLPADLDATNKELKELQSSIKSLKETRVVLSAERNKMKEGIEGLFDNVSIQTIKKKEEPKKRKAKELGDDGEDEAPESKKKVQASLSTFFGGGKKKKADPSAK